MGFAARADRGGFTYQKVSYEAVVHENNVWDVTETFVINYNEPRHGFYRYIPYMFYLNHDVSEAPNKEQAEEFHYTVKITDVSVTGGPIAKQYTEGNNLVIVIGDEDKEITGVHTYRIKYRYAYPDDRLRDRDYIFHTILGADFTQEIEEFDFNITFDKPLPDNILETLEIYSGTYGDTDNVVDAEVFVDPVGFEGSAKNVPAYHAITLYSFLPEGYYTGVKVLKHTWCYIWYGLSMFFILLILILILTRKRTKQVVKSIEFYPPEGISSAEVGVIIDDKVDTIDIASLVPWFASQGYIKIKEIDKDIQITKIKDVPGSAPQYQKSLMRLFFNKCKSIKMKDVGEKPKEMEDIRTLLQNSFSEEKGRKLVEHDTRLLAYIPLVITSLLALATNVVEPFVFDDLETALLYWATPLAVELGYRFFQSSSDIYTSHWHRTFIFIAKLLGWIFCLVLYLTLFCPYGAPLSEPMVIGLYAGVFLVSELVGVFTHDTDYRIDMMGRLLGFKEFIETAEKPRLEALQQDDPHYFYKVLPYAMVFNLSNKWARLFKDIDVERPDWYDSASTPNGHSFASNITNTMRSTAYDSISTISHDSSSSGGFAGGGGGGGGGGSW